jgi:hypothetical protein
MQTSNSERRGLRRGKADGLNRVEWPAHLGE